TQAGPDVEGPQVVRVSPEGTSVPVNAVIVVEFDEPLDPASLNEATLQLFNATTGQAVAGSRSLDASGRVAFLVPAAPLAVGTSYRAVVGPGVQDVAGNPLGFNVFSDFTTAFAADTTAPEVVKVDPADGDTGVPTNAEITI